MKSKSLFFASAMICLMASCGTGQQKNSTEQQDKADSLRQDSVMKAAVVEDSIRQDSIISATAFKGTFKAKGKDLGEIKIDLYNPTVRCCVVYESDPEGEIVDYANGNVYIEKWLLFHAKGHMGENDGKKVAPIKINGRTATFGIVSAEEFYENTLELKFIEGNRYELRVISDKGGGSYLPKVVELEKVK